MTVFLKSIILSVLALNLCACIDVLENDNDSADAQAFKAQLTEHSWQDEEAPLNGALAQITWTFSENGEFSQRYDFKHGSGNSSELINSGKYSIGESQVMASGHSAFALDLNLSYDEDLEAAPDPLRLIRYHTILISDNSLYFGQLNPSTSCEGEYYLPRWQLSGNNDEEALLEDYLNSSPTIGVQTCYARPVAMDFDKPYHKAIPVSTQ